MIYRAPKLGTNWAPNDSRILAVFDAFADLVLEIRIVSMSTHCAGLPIARHNSFQVGKTRKTVVNDVWKLSSEACPISTGDYHHHMQL